MSEPTFCCGNDAKCAGGCDCQCHSMQVQIERQAVELERLNEWIRWYTTLVVKNSAPLPPIGPVTAADAQAEAMFGGPEFEALAAAPAEEESQPIPPDQP